MMTELEKYYNKFNEEKRLKSRHGQVEFIERPVAQTGHLNEVHSQISS